MTVLVFGRTGQVACELQRLGDVTALGRDAADLSDPAACAAAIYAVRPRCVINAAAYTAVDRAEDEDDLAHVINADAPGAMARACADLDIPFLHISTDYVFDGSGTDPWAVDAPTAPLGAYGRTKLAGEKAVRATGANAVILRTSWVFSTHGTNFVKTMLRLSRTRNDFNIVNDQIGGPTPAAALAHAMLTMSQAMCAGKQGRTYHFAGTPFVSWESFARETFALADRAVTVTGIPSSGYPTPARRPLNSRLDCTEIVSDFGIHPPDWRHGLRATIKDLNI
ncbi:dTDP-4-dehydrorhamnose reductase [Roseovarius dicentrarchi]|uniref:dTDP-4-dehydrorhamnose reductase n=1 Tax=Roseovarius dicentrarchi TaxID=2250573 RepID=UPI000DE89A43|nr:dTDP-4-dehydrorhamnose reductase [Roseovarius dicentrarchi]